MCNFYYSEEFEKALAEHFSVGKPFTTGWRDALHTGMEFCIDWDGHEYCTVSARREVDSVSKIKDIADHLGVELTEEDLDSIANAWFNLSGNVVEDSVSFTEPTTAYVNYCLIELDESTDDLLLSSFEDLEEIFREYFLKN